MCTHFVDELRRNELYRAFYLLRHHLLRPLRIVLTALDEGYAETRHPNGIAQLLDEALVILEQILGVSADGAGILLGQQRRGRARLAGSEGEYAT